VGDAGEQAFLDEIGDEVDALLAGHDARKTAEHCERCAADLPPGQPGRAAWLSHAGECWELADELVEAKRCYEEALADGGPAWLDVRASLAAVLLDLDDDARADMLLQELRRDLAKGSATGSVRGPVHEYVGERLEMHGRLDDALRWFTAGVVAVDRPDAGEDAKADSVGCLNGRFRVRRALGLPHDRYDEMKEAHRRRAEADFDAFSDLDGDDDADLGGDPAQMSLAVLYWPPAEFARLLERWPAMAQDYGDQHADHRALLEQRLHELAASHSRVSVAAATVDEYLAFAERDGEDPAHGATRAGFAAHLGFVGRTVAWPPGRNAPCWCGSGTKYKKCCGAQRSSQA
jgi:hypothetical protein